MIAEKARKYFEQFKDLKVLFLFDQESTYKDELDIIADVEFLVVITFVTVSGGSQFPD